MNVLMFEFMCSRTLNEFNWLFISVAKCLGAVTVCERSFQWTKEHNLICHVIDDVEAVHACLQFLGRDLFISVFKRKAKRYFCRLIYSISFLIAFVIDDS